jgi:signal transduction histidine kinase/ligand-binding sensor domain-containing protein
MCGWALVNPLFTRGPVCLVANVGHIVLRTVSVANELARRGSAGVVFRPATSFLKMIVRSLILRRIGLPAAALASVLLQAQALGSELTTEQGYITRNWDTEEGLPASNVSALARTRDGCLWIGTPGGLVRYDGFRFKTHYPGNTPGLPDARISSLLVDRAGTLWIGMLGGNVATFTSNRFQPVPLKLDIPKAVSSLAEDATGGIWGTFERGGVFRFRDGHTSYYSTNEGLPSTMVWSMTVDGDGGVWVVSRWHLMRFENERWRDAELPADFPRVSAITPARKGGLWIACLSQTGPPTGDRGGRIFRYRNGVATEDPLPVAWNQDSRRSIPRTLVEDRQGRLWCGARGAGIFFRDNDRWKLFSESPSLSQVQLGVLFEDEDSVLWFGMDGAGLYQVRPKTVAVLEPSPGIPPSCFWTVYPARDGSVWGGTDGNGIFRWKNGTMTRFQSAQGLTNEHVNAILEDRKTNIWAGTMGGLFVLRGGRFEAVTGVDTLRLPVFALKEDRSGNIWCGTRNGLIQIGATTTNVFGQDQGIPFGPINAIEEDIRGRIWVAIPPYRDGKAPGPVAPYGLFAQSGKRFEHIAERQWNGEPNIRSLQADAAGNLWIGTISTGIYRVRDGKFTEYSLEDGLPHNRIQAVVADNAGNLWFCSELGVFGCPIAQLDNYAPGRNARLNWWQIQRAGGLPNKSATGNGQPSAARGPDGRVWFANGNALAGFDPQALIANARLWPPLIEEVLVNGLPQSPEPDGRIRVTAKSRRVEIHYTSPNTVTPDLPAFWSRLKGFDRDWVSGGVARVATYNLQPGNYEFAIAVTGPGGSRIETTSPLQIEVVPQFWERQSVRVMAGLLFVAGIALGVWRWERARSQRRFRQLEIQRAMDQVRQRIARDIHDDLGSGLTEITLLSDNLRADGNDPHTVDRTVRRIGARARALTHEMDEVVWAINPHTDTLESLVTYLNDFAQERLALAGIRCRLNTAAELPSLELSADIRHSLYRAAREALNNAIKYAGATEVVITIEPRGANLSFVIQDNGRGFDPHHVRRGNGLKNMHQRLEEIGGRCEIQSRPGSGATVTFTVPHPANRVFRLSENGRSAHR